MTVRFGRSTLFRFVVLVFFLQLIGVGAVLVTVRELTRGAIAANAEADAEQLRDEMLDAWRQGGRDAMEQAVGRRSDLTRQPKSVVLLVDGAGRHLAGNLADWPPTVGADARRTIELYLIGRDTAERMRVIATPLAGGARLLTGHVIEGELRVAGAMEDAMLTGLVVAAVLAALVAWAAAAMIEHRLRAAVDTANAVAAGALEERVPREGGGDGFDDLAGSLNAMLDRIAALMAEIRLATDGLAHDLRSPLTRLRASLDRALRVIDDEDARAHVARALDEGDRLLAMLDTALRITRAEAGLGREAFVDTDIGAMLDDMAEVYGPVAEDRGMTIRADAPAGLVVRAHRELLGQAVANLVDNALKYGGGEIRLCAARDGDALAIEVADRGAGIPAERRAEALRRFGRLDAARGEQGAGLGLSLAAAVARLHGGTLDLADNRPGLAVRLAIPLRPGERREAR